MGFSILLLRFQSTYCH